MNVFISIILVFFLMGVPTGFSIWLSTKLIKNKTSYIPAVVGVIVLFVSGYIAWNYSAPLAEFLKDILT